jgi:hypothetical protein
MLGFHRRECLCASGSKSSSRRFAAVVCATALATLLCAGSARADLLVCDFTGTSPGTNTPWTKTSQLDPSLTFSGWSRGGGVFGVASINDAFGFNVNRGATLSALSDAITANEYVTCTVTPQAGQPLDLNACKISFSIHRRSGHSPMRYALFTSVGGFVAGQEVGDTGSIGSNDYSVRAFSVFLPASGYDGLTAPIEFRLYAYEARYNHQTSLDAFRIVGVVPTYTLAVTALGSGTLTVAPGGTQFEPGTVVQIAAQPDPGARFAGWSGDLTGMGNPRSVTMDSAKSVQGHFEANPAPLMHVGSNLGGIADYSTEWCFTDLYRRSRSWQTRATDGSGAWDSGKGSFVPVDANGWPTQLPFDPGDGSGMQFAHTVIGEITQPGAYRFVYEGSGSLRFNVFASPSVAWQYLPTSTSGTLTFDFDVSGVSAAAPGAIYVELHTTAAPPNHLRNFHIFPVSAADSYTSAPFPQLFLDRTALFSCLRFMDWGATNGSPLVTWDQRTTTATYTQARAQGVALETMMRRCNVQRSDAWICIPHQSDDNYVRQAARLVRDSLAPGLKVYVEYSNETWNGIFAQTGYCTAQGQALGFAADWTAGQMYVAYRSAQIWKIFQDELGAAAPDRLVKAMATQGGNVTVTNLRMAALNDPAINPDGVMADALAIAPYFGVTFGTSMIPPYPTIDDVVTTLSQQSIAAQRTGVRAQKAVADRQGLRLVCYEGGQTFVGAGGAENDNALTAILEGANRDPRMYDRYIEYLDMLKAEGVDLFNHFADCGAWSKWGSWGALEYEDQPIAEAPKHRALIGWIAANVPAPPAAPSGVAVTSIARRSVGLAWADNSANEDGFRIERSDAGGPFAWLRDAAANTTATLDAGLAPNMVYTWRVRAFSTLTGDSAWSNDATTRTLAEPAPVPIPSELRIY